MSKLSVIVPIYGVEKYIERCADSLFKQTLSDIEFIFVDDCSPDLSIKKLENKIHEYEKFISEMSWVVRIIKTPVNCGLPSARHFGIQHATGDYIIHCDSDDWVDVEMYKTMYNSALKHNADCVLCDFSIHDGTQQKTKLKGCHSEVNDIKGLIDDLLANKGPWSLCNKMIKRVAYTADIIYPKDAMGEDLALSFQLLLGLKNVYYIPKPLYFYFINPISITNTKTISTILNKFEQLHRNTDLMITVFRKYGLSEKYAQQFLSIKWSVRRQIWNITYKKEYFDIWKSTYPEINKQILFNRYIKFKEKLRFIMTFLRVYPFKKDRVYE